MAEEWAHQLKSPLLLDEYLRVSFAALRVVDEVKWRNEEERQAAGREFGVFIEDYRAVKEDVCFSPLESQKETFCEEWGIFEKMNHMRREALSDSEKLFAGHRKEIYRCIRLWK